MEEDDLIPSSAENIYKQTTNDNTFLYSVLEYSLAKSIAMSRIKRNYSKSKDGTSSWKELIKWYEGQGSTEILAKQALQVITTHKLTAKSYGGAELYMDKFENALKDLEDLETPYDPIMAKINFLNNIKDEAYKITKEALGMDDNRTYVSYLNEIRRK